MTSTSRTSPTPPPVEKPKAAKKVKEPDFNEFLVLLDDQATREVEKAFTMPVGPKRREYVVSTLVDNMRNTQQPIWDVIEGLQASGHVSNEPNGFTPLWIQNAIVVRGDETAQQVLASAAGVAQAIKSQRYILDRPPLEALELSELGGRGKVGKGDPQWNVERLGAKKAWADGITGKGVTVGVVDTGVDVSHPALLAKYRGYDQELGSVQHMTNWTDTVPEPSPEPVDDNGHGTHVAGTILGSYGSNATGIAPQATFTAARGLGPEGGTDGMLLRSFQDMVAPRVPTPGTSPGSRRELGLGVDVINNSWGSDDGNSVAYLNALRNMAAMGVVNVFAAGNDGGGDGTLGSPASSPYVVSVAATDRKDKVANFSSRGPSPLPTIDGEPKPFVAAPGVDIRSTIPGGGYERGWQGTSMAAPAITGLVTLAQDAAVQETGNKFDINGIKAVLKKAAQDVGPKGVDDQTGYGIPVADDLRAVVRKVASDMGVKLKAQDDAAPPAKVATRTRRTKKQA